MLNTLEKETFYSPEDLAEKFQISLSSVYKLIRGGDIPHIRLGRVYRIPASDLQRYLLKIGKQILFQEPKIPESIKFLLKEIGKSSLAKEILEIWLYGSYARGDYNPDSDIDLLIVLREKTLEVTQNLSNLTESAMESVDYMELLSINKMSLKEWETMKKDRYPLAQSIQQEGFQLWTNH